MSVYKLYSASIGDGAASLDIVADGVIQAVQWAISADLDADGETYSAEISFSSTNGLTTNDTKSSVSAVRQLAADTGAAASNKLTGTNFFCGPGLGIPVKAGERMYLHTAGTAITCTAYLFVQDGIGMGRQSGRRVRL